MAVIIQFPAHKRQFAASGKQDTSADAKVLPFAPVRRRRTRHVADVLSPTEAQRVACAAPVSATSARND
jgi:hypothetical protein